ncbi:MAG TPA: DUF1440 domain-containing protein [Trueperaceae bacterium]
MNDLIRGAIAGAAATLPMTATIELINRSLPPGEQRHLPPRQITEEVAERADVKHETSERGLDIATMTTHFGFGAAMGTLYGLGAPALRLPPALTGIGYGLAVWAGNYAGILPALGLQRAPKHRPASLNATMIIGHVVWGAALGLVEERLRARRRDEWQEYQEETYAEARTRLAPQDR